jgi:hypothetical protein
MVKIYINPDNYVIWELQPFEKIVQDYNLVNKWVQFHWAVGDIDYHIVVTPNITQRQTKQEYYNHWKKYLLIKAIKELK